MTFHDLRRYAQAALVVRTFLPVLSRFGSEAPRVWLLHSQASTRLSTLQAETTLALLEPLALLGMPIGFVDADDEQVDAPPLSTGAALPQPPFHSSTPFHS